MEIMIQIIKGTLHRLKVFIWMLMQCYNDGEVNIMHIMIIEDNEKIRNELSDFLQKNGYKTSAPDDFEHILESIDQLKPCLLYTSDCPDRFSICQ